MFVSRVKGLYKYVVSFITEGMGCWYYCLALFALLSCLFAIRLPYSYGMSGFGLFIFFLVSPLPLALLITRLANGSIRVFFGGFLPPGAPLWIAPFICLVELLSYLVRPLVLMLRPFVNLTIGALVGSLVGNICFSIPWVLGFLIIFLFYEYFVTVVQWLIVCLLLAFSMED